MNFRRLQVVTFFVLAVLWAAPPAGGEGQARSQPVDAAALVREVRQGERWIEQVDSFYVRFDGVWTKTPKGIAARRAELKEQFPRIEPDPKRFSGLRPRTTEKVVLAFDAKRLRMEKDWHDVSYMLSVWDGQRATQYWKYFTHEQEHYAFDKTAARFFKNFHYQTSWPRADGHSFWWNPGDSEWIRHIHGLPEDFKLVGREEFQGIDCYVLEKTEGYRTWHVGVDDHRLHGITNLAFNPWAQAQIRSAMPQIAAQFGAKLDSHQQWGKWKSSLPADESRRVMEAYYKALRHLARPQPKHWLLDYKEVAPGCWFPMTQGYQIYRSPSADKTFVSGRRDLKAVEVRVNEPLADELFAIEIKEGVKVNDYRHDPPLFYKHKKNMTQDEWQAIVDEALQRRDREQGEQKARNKLLGKAAPAFPETATWLNSEPLTWADLAGKVVILDFWAEWCGPCRNDLPHMSELHKEREENGIIVIGIHTPSNEIEKINAVVKEHNLQYPTFIDSQAPANASSWGLLFSQYGVLGIPHAFVIDKNGKVAGNGRLSKVLPVARRLAHRKANGSH